MPNRDGGGPNGAGPRTGRGAGKCPPVGGGTRSKRRGIGRGRGNGQGRRRRQAIGD